MAAYCGRPAPHNGHKWPGEEHTMVCSGVEIGAPHRNPPRDRQAEAKARAEAQPDNVDHPSHYNWLPNGIEVIDITEHFNFRTGNALKYIMRADHKGKPVEDIRKAIWYLQRELDARQKGEN
jgi:hypothetical protein